MENKEKTIVSGGDAGVQTTPESKNILLDLLSKPVADFDLTALTEHLEKILEAKETSTLIVNMNKASLKTLTNFITSDVPWTGTEAILVVEIYDALNAPQESDKRCSFTLRTIEGLAFLVSKKTSTGFYSANQFANRILIPIMDAYNNVKTINAYIEQLKKSIQSKQKIKDNETQK